MMKLINFSVLTWPYTSLTTLVINESKRTFSKQILGHHCQEVMDNVYPFVDKQVDVFTKGTTFRLPNHGWEERNQIRCLFG
jgi:hypothetical protein